MNLIIIHREPKKKKIRSVNCAKIWLKFEDVINMVEIQRKQKNKCKIVQKMQADSDKLLIYLSWHL